VVNTGSPHIISEPKKEKRKHLFLVTCFCFSFLVSLLGGPTGPLDDTPPEATPGPSIELSDGTPKTTSVFLPPRLPQKAPKNMAQPKTNNPVIRLHMTSSSPKVSLPKLRIGALLKKINMENMTHELSELEIESSRNKPVKPRFRFLTNKEQQEPKAGEKRKRKTVKIMTHTEVDDMLHESDSSSEVSLHIVSEPDSRQTSRAQSPNKDMPERTPIAKRPRKQTVSENMKTTKQMDEPNRIVITINDTLNDEVEQIFESQISHIPEKQYSPNLPKEKIMTTSKSTQTEPSAGIKGLQMNNSCLLIKLPVITVPIDPGTTMVPVIPKEVGLISEHPLFNPNQKISGPTQTIKRILPVPGTSAMIQAAMIPQGDPLLRSVLTSNRYILPVPVEPTTPRPTVPGPISKGQSTIEPVPTNLVLVDQLSGNKEQSRQIQVIRTQSGPTPMSASGPGTSGTGKGPKRTLEEILATLRPVPELHPRTSAFSLPSTPKIILPEGEPNIEVRLETALAHIRDPGVNWQVEDVEKGLPDEWLEPAKQIQQKIAQGFNPTEEEHNFYLKHRGRIIR